ncbi:hypothetical protein J4207_01700 [Candidatus Woesearchaeota archaeon]|nr:hypothetical protein [Candidatus Woesearchaeota archaeon]
MRKRGQVTLFIILGALLLVGLLLFVVFRERITLSQILPDRIFPTKTGTIQRFIDGCIEAVGTEGLTLLGAQGGYIELPDDIERNWQAYIDTGIKVPHWHYNGENRIPSFVVMENHLNRYVNDNLRACLNNLAEFQQQYTIIEKGDVTTTTRIQDEDVAFLVEYPLEVRDKEGKKITDIEDFRVEVSLLLKKMTEVATSIMSKEAETMKFERLTIDLLSLDSDIPTSGTDLQCNRKQWVVSEVREKLQTLLRRNLPTVRVDFTSYLPIPQDQPYVQSHYVWPVTEFQYNDISVGFTFVEQPFHFAVRPRSGNLLKSNQLKGQELASFVCLQQWNFVYDVDYPVLVSVEDKKHNYVLNFGFIVRVKNNRGAREPTPTEIVAFDPIEADGQKYCENTYGGYHVTVKTYDNVSDPTFGETYDSVNDVDVSFTCLRYTCTVGKTKYTQGGVEASVGNIVPSCVNGVLKATKEGFKPAQQFFTPSADDTISIYLTPLKVLRDYKVMKRVEQNGVLLPARALDSDEQAFITLRYVVNKSVMHETWGIYPAGQKEPLEMLAGASFPVELEIYVMKGTKITGGYVGTWKAEWAELHDAKSIEFQVLSASTAGDDELAVFFGSLSTKQEQLKPVIR